MQDNLVLIVEDDNGLRSALADTLTLSGFKCEAVSSAEAALACLEPEKFSIVISDINLDGMDGHSLLLNIKRQVPELPILLMTAYGSINNAVQAMRDGAVDYLIKPFEPEVLVAKVQQYRRQIITSVGNPVAEDPSSKALLALALKVVNTEATVMITGPSGTGKEVLARYIHDNSKRAAHPFVAINCAAIPENMLEATLFGYEKGAFTGAHQATPGKFEQAQNGTLLLDEISEMDLQLQAKILRVLQEREVERLGGKKIIPLNVRVLATSNRDLLAAVKEGKFREDLYYRLNVFPLQWLPLKDRPLDIVPMAKHLLARYAGLDKRDVPVLSKASQHCLQQYDWPGNIREMGNVMQRALILCQGDEITPEDLQLELFAIEKPEPNNNTAFSGLDNDMKNHEFSVILEKMEAYDGNRQKVAESLGISPRTLRYKLAKMRDSGITV